MPPRETSARHELTLIAAAIALARAVALGVHVLAADGRRAALARRRIRPAQAALRPPAAARARLLRPPADRPADVPCDRRPAGRALLPRLRARVHPPVDPDDRARGDRDDRHRTAPRPDLARARAVRRADLLPLRPPRAPGDPADPAAHRRADRRRRGEHLRGARRQGVRPRAAPAAALPGQRRARVRPGDGGDPPGSEVQPDDRLPAPARPRRRAVDRRQRRDPRAPDTRSVHGVLPVPEHADRPDAHARRDPQPRPARHRLGRASVPGPRPSPTPDLAARGATAAGRQRARAATGRHAAL